MARVIAIMTEAGPVGPGELLLVMVTVVTVVVTTVPSCSTVCAQVIFITIIVIPAASSTAITAALPPAGPCRARRQGEDYKDEDDNAPCSPEKSGYPYTHMVR